MKLLYLYVENYGCIEDQEFNFDSEIQFHYDSKNTHELTVVKQDLLPKNFWGGGSIESISAIVGNNGAGKTTIARFIADLLYYTDNLKDSHFIVIFQTDTEGTQCIYNLEMSKVNSCKVQCTSLTEYIDKVICGDENDPYIPTASEYYDIGFIYHSNHYSPAHKWEHFYLDDLDNSFDLSTTAYLYRDTNINFKNRLAKQLDISLYKHKNFEYNRILSLMQKVFSKKLKMSEKIKHIIPLKIIIDDVTTQYFLRKKNVINEKIMKIVNDENQAEKHLKYLETFIKTSHNKKETFIDFRIKTYVKLALIDTCIVGSTKIKELLDCIQETNDSIDEEKNFKRIIDFLSDIKYPRIRYFVNLISSSQNNNKNNIIKVNKYGHIVINCPKHLSELMKVFNNEAEFFYSRDCFSFQFSPGFSSGELSFLTIFSRLYDFFLSPKTQLVEHAKDFIIFCDEIEITLEPNLQRYIISFFIDFLNIVFPEYSFHIIFATHSPILLSDIPDSNVMFLKKDYKTGHTITANKNETGKTFGSNIYTLYKKSFFMDDGLMGEFATKKIEIIIKELIALETKKVKDKNKRENKYQELEKEIDLIGEPVIRTQLNDRLKWVKMRIQ